MPMPLAPTPLAPTPIAPTPISHASAAQRGWPALLWPTAKRPRVGAAGEFGRFLHWLGVIAAVLCVLMAVEFLVEGWAIGLSRNLLVAAFALTFGARGLRYVLARE